MYAALLIYKEKFTKKGPKFGFVVPKKAIPKAVDRNLIERRLRAVFHLYEKVLDEDCVVVIQVRKEALGASFADLRSDIAHLLERSFPTDTIHL